MENKKSGKHWVTWANSNAKNSKDLNKLVNPFKTNLIAFKKALEDAGATIKISSTRRNAKRAYLFHWSWKIALKKCKPSEATAMTGVDILWDHDDDEKSIAGADEMVKGFGLAIPPSSKVAPSLTSNHIRGKAIDMTITWKKSINVKAKGKTKKVAVTYMTNANLNTKLHEVGATYDVKKHKKDKPHWSYNGR